MSATEYITRAEHEEFIRRVEDEKKRTSKRIQDLEGMRAEQLQLIRNVERLAVAIDEQTHQISIQSERIRELEMADGKKWKTAAMAVLSTLAGAVGSMMLRGLGG